MASFTDRLAFILEFKGDDFIRGIRKAGDEADKQVARAKSSSEKFGATATKVGTGLLAFAGVAAGGLFKAAQAAEQARFPLLQLNNTIANSPKLAGASAAEFVKLAEAIQDKTAADGDQVVAAQAMLGTFQLTAEQIKAITPLVVDYSRKFGVDMTSAAIQVGKALDGQIGALKRNGVSIDENLFKVDRFRAVTEALRTQVGGFAEQEVTTLSGRLQRLKNELGDVEEGVGAGVTSAFSAALTPVEKVTEAIGKLPPGAQEAAGKMATLSAAAAAGVGGLSLLAGQAAKMRANFVDASGQINNFGRAAKGLATVAGSVAAVYGLAAAVDAVSGASEKAARRLEELQTKRAAELVDEFERQAERMRDVARVSNSGLKEFFDPTTLADTQRKLFRQLADENEAAAKRLRDAWKAAGRDTADFDEILAKVGARNRQLASDARANADATAELGEAETAATTATKQHTDALAKKQEILDAVRDSIEKNREAVLADADAELALARADDNVQDALNRYNDALREHGATSDEARRAQLDYRSALLSAADAAVKAAEQDRAAKGLAALTTQEKVAVQIAELDKLKAALGPGSPLAAAIEDYKARLRSIPTEIATKLSIFGNANQDLQVEVNLGGGMKARAAGGPLAAGETAIVGERGPEIVTAADDVMVRPLTPVTQVTNFNIAEVRAHDYRDFLVQLERERRRRHVYAPVA